MQVHRSEPETGLWMLKERCTSISAHTRTIFSPISKSVLIVKRFILCNCFEQTVKLGLFITRKLKRDIL
jgi:hypothetical protein